MRYPTPPRRRIVIAVRMSDVALDAVKPVLCEAQIDIVAAHPTVDVYVTDLRGHNKDGPIGQAIHQGRQTALAAPHLFLIDEEQLSYKSIRKLTVMDNVVQHTESCQPLISAIYRAIADMDRAREAGVRMTSLASHGIGMTPLPPIPVSDMTILLCEPSPVTLSLLTGIGSIATISAVIKPSQALQALEVRQADALLIKASRNRRPQAAIMRLIRRHSELYSTPIIVLEERISERQIAYWTECGADAVLSTEHMGAAMSLLERLSRARHARKGTDEILRQTVVSDLGQVSRLAAARYFETCLAHRLETPRLSFSIGALRLDPSQGEDHTAALSEAAIYLAMATRMEDLVMRPAPDVFIISCPGADMHHTKVMLNAMASMVRDLKFGPHNRSCTFDTQINIVSMPVGTKPETAIAEALQGLPQRQIADLLPV